ncbi:MAG: dUTP diphosphatase [Clostridia bacterium]|nr:dUTP diphosphatase [Clostridia bacterium]
MEITVRFKKLREGAKVPRYATPGSAACDLCYAGDDPLVIAAGATALVPTGIAISLGKCDVAAFIYARSGLASKRGIAPANCVGVIDSDYRGEIMVALRNSSAEDFTVAPGDRIAQMVISPVISARFEEADELDETDRGAGGFGSTGK